MVVLGESPGRTEVAQGRPFVGDSGEYLGNIFSYYDIPRIKCHITNAVLCWPDRATPSEWSAAIAACRPRLVKELSNVTTTTTILALGGRALESVAGRRGMFDWIGAPAVCIDGLETWTALPALHPAFVLRPEGRPHAPVLHVHVGRAWQLATGKLSEFKWPTIHIEPNEEALAALGRIAKRGGPIGFDVETRGKDPMAAPLMSLAIADEHDAVSLPWERYVAKGGQLVKELSSYPLGKELARVCKHIIENPKIEKVLQNGQHDILSCERLGWTLRGYAFDCLYAHAIVLPGGRHDLGAMAAIEFPADRWKSAFHVSSDAKGLDSFVKRDPLDLRRYNAKDAAATVLLRKPLEKRLAQANNGLILNAANLRRAKIALDMRRRGVQVDTSKFDSHRKRIARKRRVAAHKLRVIAGAFGYSPPPRDDEVRALKKLIARCRYVAKRATMLLELRPEDEQVKRWKRIRNRARRRRSETEKALAAKYLAAAANPFNPNSNRHLNDLFFHKLKLTASAYSFKTNAPKLDEDQLVRAVTHPNALVAAAARALLSYRKANKMLSTYIDGMPMDKNRVVHPTWNVTGTRTQRWSAQDPSVMQIPKPILKKRKDGTKYIAQAGLRDLFIGFANRDKFGLGRNWVVEADYKQLELKIIAQLSGDEPLLTGYQAGADVHTINARDLFGIEKSAEVPKAMRDLAKVFAYAANYGGSAETIWKSIAVDFPHVTLLQVARMLQMWFAKHPAIAKWQNSILKEVRLKDYMEAPLSGHRNILFGLIDPKKIFNWPVQHTGADIINPRLEAVATRLKWQTEGILFQYHDALICDSPDPVRLARILQQEMTAEVELNGSKLTYDVDLKIGPSWGQAVEVKSIDEIPALCAKLVAEQKAWATSAHAPATSVANGASSRSTKAKSGNGS